MEKVDTKKIKGIIILKGVIYEKEN